MGFDTCLAVAASPGQKSLLLGDRALLIKPDSITDVFVIFLSLYQVRVLIVRIFGIFPWHRVPLGFSKCFAVSLAAFFCLGTSAGI